MPAGPLGDYLNNHMAGAAFGSDLAGHLVRRAGGTPLEGTLDQVASEIAEDRETLSELMDRLGVTRNPIKEAVTWLGEKGSRVGLEITSAGGDEHFGLFLGLEALSLGIEGKACMWLALATLTERYPELVSLDLRDLEARAREQRATVETVRITAAALALTGSGR